MFLMVARHCELIFCLLTRPKCDFAVVVKSIIQVVGWYFEVIFCFMTTRNCDLFNIDKATIQVV